MVLPSATAFSTEPTADHHPRVPGRRVFETRLPRFWEPHILAKAEVHKMILMLMGCEYVRYKGQMVYLANTI